MYIKSPLEKLDYGKDWSDFLLPDETLQSVGAFCTPAGLYLQNAGISGKNTVVWVSSGTVGESYRVTFLVTTSTGAIATDSFFLKVELK